MEAIIIVSIFFAGVFFLFYLDHRPRKTDHKPQKH